MLYPRAMQPPTSHDFWRTLLLKRSRRQHARSRGGNLKLASSEVFGIGFLEQSGATKIA